MCGMTLADEMPILLIRRKLMQYGAAPSFRNLPAELTATG
jgi:hypothetical protein